MFNFCAEISWYLKSCSTYITYILDILFCQITMFIKLRVAFVTEAYQLKYLKPKNIDLMSSKLTWNLSLSSDKNRWVGPYSFLLQRPVLYKYYKIWKQWLLFSIPVSKSKWWYGFLGDLYRGPKGNDFQMDTTCQWKKTVAAEDFVIYWIT